MQANKDPFMKKYNILENLCKERYPECKKKGKNAVKYFADFSGLVSKKDQDALRTIVSVRNTIHDPRNLFSVNRDCLNLMDGVIRALQSGAQNPINPALENLKTDNLKKMSEAMRNIQSKIYMAPLTEQKRVKERLLEFIEKEKRAIDIASAKSGYFDFFEYYNNIRNIPVIKKARAANVERSLERKKQAALSEIQCFYSQALAETLDEPFLSRGNAKRKLKIVLDGYKTRILNCPDFDELEEIIEKAEMDFGCW